MKVAVIGTGYVGLVAGACLAETGNDVICVDIAEKRIENLKKGIIPIYEPGLETIVHRNIQKGRLTFSMDTADAVSKSLVVFLAVPTPQSSSGAANLEYVFEGSKQIAVGINGYKVIVDKSTVPVGTAAQVREIISRLTEHEFDVLSVPEFLKEGNAVDDFMKPDRVIIGCNSQRAEEIMRDLYAPFVRTGHPMIVMKTESAELTKYAANAMLATKISFMNDLARLCETVGADINDIRLGIGSDRRIGNSFLFPGIGFGGSCFPKDLEALHYTALAHKSEMPVVKATIEANTIQKQFMPKKILKRFNDNLDGVKFALWGLSFKAETDDMRESPALALIEKLLAAGATITAYDPEAMDGAQQYYNELLYAGKYYGDRLIHAEDSYAALEGCDALIVATEWNEFRRPDFERMKSVMRQPIIFDGRNLFKAEKMRKLGFEYQGVGQAQ